MSNCLGKIQNEVFLDHIGHGNFRSHKKKSMENSNPGKLCVSLSMISTKWSATLLSNTKKRHAAVSSAQTPADYCAQWARMPIFPSKGAKQQCRHVYFFGRKNPSCTSLLGPARLLILRIFSYLHVYSVLHVY